ncbi:hypothetical protein T492DRAFT_875127 [Pavlovales sp. CCMP2436]|nr:hypothetical protein T492DRAFT_875127 [Pavlovales sp. CCMP2436]
MPRLRPSTIVAVPELESLCDEPPSGGCTTRSSQAAAWRALASRATRAQPLLLGYLYAVVWEPDLECTARYDELFAAHPNFLALDARPARWPTAAWTEYDNQDGTHPIRRVNGRSVFVKTQRFVSAEGYKASVQMAAERHAWLRPRDELSALAALVARRAHAKQACI